MGRDQVEGGFEAGDRLCVYLANCPDMIDVFLACLKLGVIFVPINILYREVRAFCAKGLTPEQRAHAEFFRKIKPYVQAWYGTWHESMLDQPFYRVNSRI